MSRNMFLLLQEANKFGTISLRNFYTRRALRIFPVYYLFLLVLASLQVFYLYSDTLSTWLGSLTYTRNMFGQGKSATGHLWSLSVEEQFYFIWPAVLVTLRLYRRWPYAIIVLLLVIAVSFAARLTSCSSDTFLCVRILNPKSALRYADLLAVGCIGAFIYANLSFSISRTVKVIPLYSIVALLAFSTIISPAPGLEASIIITAQAVAIMFCIALSMSERNTIFFRLLNSRVIIFVGLISYSLYIWHMIFLSHYVGDGISGTVLHDSRVWWIASVALASASYFLFERPLIRLKTRFQVSRAPTMKTETQLDTSNSRISSVRI